MDFKGNKAALPCQICLACGREMVWRKLWAKNGDEVNYRSDASCTKKPQTSVSVNLSVDADHTVIK